MYYIIMDTAVLLPLILLLSMMKAMKCLYNGFSLIYLNLPIKFSLHDRPGIVSMANKGPNSM